MALSNGCGESSASGSEELRDQLKSCALRRHQMKRGSPSGGAACLDRSGRVKMKSLGSEQRA